MAPNAPQKEAFKRVSVAPDGPRTSGGHACAWGGGGGAPATFLTGHIKISAFHPIIHSVNGPPAGKRAASRIYGVHGNVHA